MKLTIVGGGGFRVPLVYGALLEKAARLGLDEVVLHDVDADPAGRASARCWTGWPPSTASGSRSARRPTSRTPSRAPTSSSPRSASGSSRGASSTRACPLGLGVLGQETTGPGGICFALRTIPAMVALAEVMAERAPQAWLINFTNPAGHGDRGGPAGPRRACGRHLRLAVGHVPARRRRARPRPGASSGSTTSGLNHLGWLQGVRDRGDELLGGPARRRRRAGRRSRRAGCSAASGCGRSGWSRTSTSTTSTTASDTVDAIRASPALARRVPARAAGARSTRTAARTRRTRSAAWRATRHDRERTYMAEARAAAGEGGDHAARRERRLRERGDGRARGDGARTRARS